MDTNSFVLTLLNLKGWGPTKVYNYINKYSFDYEKCRLALAEELTDKEKERFKNELLKSKNKIQNNLKLGVKCCNIFDSFFPKKLYDLDQKCIFLFYKGNIELLNKKSITIIGSRNLTEAFVEKGKMAVEYFSKKGYVIVSGLALGCDSLAHKVCLESKGMTIAVLPTSCDKIMPTSNKTLANNIVNNNGLLISEYGTDDPFNKYNFAERDRIQSLLSNTILIIEAQDSSGTMIATRKHIANNKHVFALEGNKLLLVKNYIDTQNINDLKIVEDSIQ